MTLRVHWKLICIVLICGDAGLKYSPTSAQEIPAASQGGYVQAMAPIAIAGEPFGVLRVEVPLPPNLSSGPPRVLVDESQGRLFYPAIVVRTVEVLEQQPAPGIGRRGGLIDRLRKVVRGQPQKRQVPVAITVSALFRGDGPIELQLTGDIEQRVRIVPSSSVASGVLGVGATSVSHAALLSQWWTAYTQSARQALAEDDFPKLVHKVLVSMLGARLNLPAVDLDPADEDEEELSQPLKTLALLSAIEPLREEILDEVLAAPAPAAVPNLPLPPEPLWEPAVLPPVPADVVIESLATRVPPECFYLRFGSFSNYVWFQELAERYGGDIANRYCCGFNYDASARMERMLATKLTAIAKMFGDKLVGDMAIVGSDMYMKEGASVGVMLLATNPQLLTASIESERKGCWPKIPMRV
ncbi:MAG: hypothetical protein R3C56_17980 [Pirellulaceae bacterium]